MQSWVKAAVTDKNISRGNYPARRRPQTITAVLTKSESKAGTPLKLRLAA